MSQCTVAPAIAVAEAVTSARPPRQEPGDLRSPRTGGRQRSRLWVLPAYLAMQTAQLLVLWAVAPRFFWLDDAQIQFTPMAWWLGRNFTDGGPPLLDPDQGMSGNLTADMQYGVLDVVRWPFLLFAGQQDDLLLVATVYAWVSILVLGTAALAVLLNHRTQPTLAIAGALGVATSGFIMWWGSAWAPIMWSSAALVWLWAALSSRRSYRVVGIALSSTAVVCSGNPYLLPLVPVLVAVHAYERHRDVGRGFWRSAQAVGTLLALLAGAALSVPTLVNVLDVAQWMWRPAPDFTVAADGRTMNLLDIVVGGTTQLTPESVPMMSTLVVALPLLALVDWPRAVRRPGVVTAGVLFLTCLAITQLPTHVFAFRFPFRLLVGVQVFLGLLAVLAFTHARALTRRRLLVAGSLVLLQAGVALSRSPVLWRWHLLGLVLATVALAASSSWCAASRAGPGPHRPLDPSGRRQHRHRGRGIPAPRSAGDDEDRPGEVRAPRHRSR